MGAPLKLSVFHGEPGFWSGAHGTLPNPAPVYGLAKDRDGNVLDLDEEVLIHLGMALQPKRGIVVGIGDQGLPNRQVVKVRLHKSAYVHTYGADDCEPHSFDEYKWLCAETKASEELAKRNVDLARATFGGFYFEAYQRLAMKHYLAEREKGGAK